MLTAPTIKAAAAIGAVQLVASLIMFASATRDAVLRTLTALVLIHIVISVLAVRSIKGEILFYLVTWVSAVGLLFCMALGAWLESRRPILLPERWVRGAIAVGAVGFLILAVSWPLPRPSMFRQPDIETEQLARSVEAYLLKTGVNRPTVYIESREDWPIAVAIVLYLVKRGVPVYVQREWVNVVGRPLAERPDSDANLLVAVESQTNAGNGVLIAKTRRVSIYLHRRM